VWISLRGRLELEGCDIASESLACVAIRNGADPRLRRNRIHDGKDVGVYVYDSGMGTLEDNDITANANTGVTVRSGGNPTLRRNRINRNTYEAVRVYEGGRGVIENNDLTGNKRVPGTSPRTPWRTCSAATIMCDAMRPCEAHHPARPLHSPERPGSQDRAVGRYGCGGMPAC
jgi:parallel beta-helix repeat protein